MSRLGRGTEDPAQIHCFYPALSSLFPPTMKAVTNKAGLEDMGGISDGTVHYTQSNDGAKKVCFIPGDAEVRERERQGQS